MKWLQQRGKSLDSLSSTLSRFLSTWQRLCIQTVSGTDSAAATTAAHLTALQASSSFSTSSSSHLQAPVPRSEYFIGPSYTWNNYVPPGKKKGIFLLRYLPSLRGWGGEGEILLRMVASVSVGSERCPALNRIGRLFTAFYTKWHVDVCQCSRCVCLSLFPPSPSSLPTFPASLSLRVSVPLSRARAFPSKFNVWTARLRNCSLKYFENGLWWDENTQMRCF